MAPRGRPTRRERGHEGDGGGGVERAHGHPAPPPLDAGPEVLRRLRPLGEPVERRRHAVLVPRAVRRAPLLELGRARQEEAVEERALVQLDGTLELTVAQGRLELLHVAGEPLTVEAQVASRDEQVVGAQRARARRRAPA
jgi:hypothetical protein